MNPKTIFRKCVFSFQFLHSMQFKNNPIIFPNTISNDLKLDSNVQIIYRKRKRNSMHFEPNPICIKLLSISLAETIENIIFVLGRGESLYLKFLYILLRTKSSSTSSVDVPIIFTYVTAVAGAMLLFSIHLYKQFELSFCYTKHEKHKPEVRWCTNAKFHTVQNHFSFYTNIESLSLSRSLILSVIGIFVNSCQSSGYCVL